MTEPRPKCEDCKHYKPAPPKPLDWHWMEPWERHACLHTGRSAMWERAVNIGQVVNCGPKGQFFEAARKKAVQT